MDKYYVYRPMLDLIGFTEGTDKGRGYNETLAYGAYTGGDVVLVDMTLAEIDKLQTKMLKHPKNKLNSSALGRYQIVRTTMRSIKKTLGLANTELFDRDMQDRMACYLLGVRGIDKWLSGRLSTDTLLLNLAKEWASFPTPAGKGFYGGQHAAVSPARVKKALAEVKARHAGGQPVNIPESVPEAAKKETGLWGWLTTALGVGGGAVSGFAGMEWQTIAAFAVVAVVGVVLVAFIGPRIARSIRRMKEELA